MGKAKAKIASKNNPEGRKQAKEYFHNGEKIKPVKLINDKRSILAAEYESTGELVIGSGGHVLPWNKAKLLG